MRVLLSGQAAAAISLSPPYILYRLDKEPSPLGDRYLHGLRYFDGCTDVYEFEVDGEGAISSRLEAEWSVDRSLRLFLLALGETRVNPPDRIFKALEDLLQDEKVVTRLKGHLCVTNIPVFLEVNKIRDAAGDAPAALDVLDWLFAAQEIIKDARAKFEQAADEFDLNAIERRDIYFRLASDGVLLNLVQGSLEEGDLSFEIIRIGHTYPKYRAVLTRWVQSVARPSAIRTDRVPRVNAPAEETDDFDVAESGAGLFGRQIYERVRHQQRAIVELLKSRDVVGARERAEALVAEQRASSNDAQIGMTLCLLAQEAKEHGQPELQIEWALRATEVSPGDPKSFGHLFDAYFGVGDLHAASGIVEKIVSSGGQVFADGCRGRLLKASGRFEEARSFLLTSYAEHEGHPDALYLLTAAADILKDLGNVNGHVQEFASLTERFPLESYVWVGYGLALLSAGRSADALKIFNTSLQHKVNEGALLGRASAYKQAGDFVEAAKIYEKVLEKYPFNEYALCGVADIALSRGMLDEAYRAFDHAASVLPYSASALNGKAQAYFYGSRFIDALKAFEAASQRFPFNEIAARGVIRTLQRLGRLPEALRRADAYSESIPFSLDIKALRAKILAALGQSQAALRQLTESLERNPRHTLSLCVKASILILTRKYEEALLVLPKRIPSIRSEWRLWTLRGLAHARLGHADLAVKELKEALHKCPFYSERKGLRSSLAKIYLEKKRFHKARETVLERVEEVENVVAFHVLAATNRVPDARTVFENAKFEEGRFVINFMEEVARRTRLLRQEPRENVDWLKDTEERILLSRVA